MVARRSSKKDAALSNGPAQTTAVLPVAVEKIVTFHLGGQVYALPIDRVQEIQQIVEFTQVPDDSPAILGMVNLRGLVIPALDTHTLLGMSVVEHTIDTPMIICRSSQGLVALIVEQVDDVVDLPEGCLQAAPSIHSLASRMVGVCRFDTGMVFLLDVDALLEPVELPEVEGDDAP